jgi:gliding motility-associated-like protein
MGFMEFFSSNITISPIKSFKMKNQNILLFCFSKIKAIFFLAVFFLSVILKPAQAQTKLWEASFYGGVTTGGYSPEYQSGGEGTFEVKIEKGSTIKKAYLMAGRFGVAQPLTITMNGKSYLFDKNNMATKQYESRTYGGPSCVHAIDVTADIKADVSQYKINVPQQAGPTNRFNDFYLFIAYENKSMKKVSTAIYLRNSDIAAKDKFKIDLSTATSKASDVAVSLYCGYICHMHGDGEFVSLNNEKLGQIGGHDDNSGYCGGPIGSFYYKDNKLYGLGDDKADKAVDGSDALINAKSILKDKCKSFNLDFEVDNSQFGEHETNAIWGVIVAYGTSECSMEDAKASDDVDICKGSTATIAASGGTKYLWSTGEVSDTIKVKPLTTTKYYVTISDEGCSAKDSVIVNVVSNLVADAGKDTTICSGTPVTLKATGGGTYKWSNGEKTQSIIVKPKSTLTYIVTVTSGSCMATDKVTVTVNPNPTIDAGNDFSVPMDSSAVIHLKGPDGKYSWSPENGLSCLDCKTPTVTPDSTITYIVTYKDANGCSALDSVTIHTKERQAYYLTNPFTPNGDGKNDLFMVSLRRGKNLNYSIYDKAGKLVFKSSADQYEWDGKVKGQMVPSGVYVYYLNYIDEDGKPVKKTGMLNLIR